MYPASLEKLIECFRKLPGVGAKTEERYALLISEMEESQVREFAEALIDVKEKLHHCSICGNISEGEECSICSDPDRNHKQIFVVQSPKDVIAMENTGEYHGVYHVLNGLISSTKGIMPEDLNHACRGSDHRYQCNDGRRNNGNVSGSSAEAEVSGFIGNQNCPWLAGWGNA